MRALSQIFAVFIIVCFLSTAAVSGKLWANEDPVSQFLSLNDPGEGGFDQSANQSPSGTSQTQPSLGKTVTAPVTPLSRKGKFYFYLRTTYGPGSILSIVPAAAILQARDKPPEWGQGMEGYGRRYASTFGLKVIKQSIQSGVEGLLSEDPRYYSSARTGVFQRAFYAIGQTFVSHKDSGSTGFAYARVIGIVGGVCISRQWHPESDRSAEDYVVASAAYVGLDMARYVFREFWPDIKRKLFRK